MGNKCPITLEKLEQVEAALTEAIQQKWNEEQVIDQENAGPALESEDIWSLPQIDSKVAFKLAATALEEILDYSLSPSDIKNGGYDSIEEMISDLLAKMRASCSDSGVLASDASA